MPILAPEVDCHPVHLLDEAGEHERRCMDLARSARDAPIETPHDDDPDGRHWWALYTRSRREKDLMRRLLALDVPFFGPMIPKPTRSPSGRVRTAYVPLFPNYVFIYGDEFSRRASLATNCVSRCLDVADAARLAHDLRQIRRLIDSRAPLTPESRLLPGVRVRVRSGPLKGCEGVIVGRRNERRLLVAVDFLQQGASAQVDDFDVEPI